MVAAKGWYRKVDLLQRTKLFKYSASALVLLACAVVFGLLLSVVHDLDTQRRALVLAMTDQNYENGDAIALALYEKGTVQIGEKVYGGEEIAQRPDLVFDAGGNIERPDLLAEVFLRSEYPAWAPRWLLDRPGTTWMLGILTVAWLLLIIWMEITVPFLLTAVGTAVPVIIAGLFGWRGLMLACAGMGLLTFTFVLLMRLAALLLNRPNQVSAVAHTVLKEASRTKIPLVFIIAILVLLPLLPLGLDPDSPLQFRIQTFISRSLGFTYYLAACMTLFLACATVAFEVRDRQIWQLMTKPVSRLKYLLGKWLGVITVNAIILIIAAVSSFTFIQYLRERDVSPGLRGAADLQMVRDAVLTARVGGQPDYHELTAEQLSARVESEIQRRPDILEMSEDGSVSVALRREIRRQIEDAHETGQRSVPPGQYREYLFSGLENAKRLGSTLTLRYRFHILRDDEHETFNADFMFNRNPELLIRRRFVPTMSHVLSVPTDWIQEDGTLQVAIRNPVMPRPDRGMSYGAINFEADDFELLYKVDSFEANFFRAVLIDWIKLSFLGMLGICCATFLSFSVACLMSFTIFVAGTIGPFLAMSLDTYEPISVENVDWGDFGVVIHWAFQWVIRSIGLVVVYVLEAFGKYRPTQLLVEGRLIPWGAVGGSLLRIGVLWSGLALIAGFLVLRKRQLAIYSGQG